jgi:ketosteroid isomerase-like protein
MSQENVAIERRAIDAWQRDDLDSWLATFHPDIEYHAAVERSTEGPAFMYRGHEGMRPDVALVSK